MVWRAEFSDSRTPVVVCVASSGGDRDSWTEEVGNISLCLGSQVVACELADGGMAQNAPRKGIWEIRKSEEEGGKGR